MPQPTSSQALAPDPAGTDLAAPTPGFPASKTAERAAAWIEATKPGITRLVTVTAGVGFVMAWLAPPDRMTCLRATLVGGACLAGTALSAAGANAINQWMERDRDARMKRTAGRPIPTGRATPTQVIGLGLVLAAAGVALLAVVNGVVPALVSLACVLSYVLLYTPMKPRTPLSTYAGTIPGALPPMIGWAAASGSGWDEQWASLGLWGGWALVALMVVWQLPHFFAIGWMYRDDYAAGGYRTLPVVDPSGRRTARAVLLWSIVLVPVSLTPAWAMPGVVGAPYAVLAGVAGLGFLWLCVGLARERTRDAARRVFFASIAYLPLVMLAMVAEAVLRTLAS
ncbi:MAG: protoheme IX farnesyltransferase [Phycisphaeraceae bacterium]|nr:MAG: protoheme IX farnesyltransferase [Phycisphaeraceae bacterium]